MKKIKVISYNIHSGTDFYRRPTLEKMGQYLKQEDADIITLQEVHQNDEKGKQAEFLADILNMDYCFGANHPVGNGAFGNAILSKYPIQSNDNILLPSKKEQRGLLINELIVRNRLVYILTTHLGLNRRERSRQMREIKKILGKEAISNHPVLLTGDFNTVHPISFSPLIDTGRKSGHSSLPTLIPIRKRIDFIFASPHFHLLQYHVDNRVKWSDHYPVITKLFLHHHHIDHHTE